MFAPPSDQAKRNAAAQRDAAFHAHSIHKPAIAGPRHPRDRAGGFSRSKNRSSAASLVASPCPQDIHSSRTMLPSGARKPNTAQCRTVSPESGFPRRAGSHARLAGTDVNLMSGPSSILTAMDDRPFSLSSIE
jgi:hypothetical protein